MGRVVGYQSAEAIVKNNVESFITDSTKNYPSFLESAPYFVTYYSLQRYKSTHDVSFEVYNEVVGEESPNRFHRIERFPVYDLETGDFSTNLNDDGYEANLTSTFLVLPDTVRPMVDDLVEIEIHTQKYLFIVTDVNQDNYGNSTFFKVSIKLSQYTKDEANRNTDKIYETNYEDIGKGGNVILPKTLAHYLRMLKTSYDEILSSTVERYYNKHAGALVNDNRYLDSALNHFVERNGLLKPFKHYRNSAFINPTLTKMMDRFKYSKTFFTMLERYELAELNSCPSYAVTDTTRDNTIKYGFNYFLTNNVIMLDHSTIEDIANAKYVFDLNFFDIATTEDTIGDPYLRLIKAFIEFVRVYPECDYNVDLAGIDSLESVLARLNDIYPRYINTPTSGRTFSPEDYYIQPVLLYIMKTLYYIIIGKPGETSSFPVNHTNTVINKSNSWDGKEW